MNQEAKIKYTLKDHPDALALYESGQTSVLLDWVKPEEPNKAISEETQFQACATNKYILDLYLFDDHESHSSDEPPSWFFDINQHLDDESIQLDPGLTADSAKICSELILKAMLEKALTSFKPQTAESA